MTKIAKFLHYTVSKLLSTKLLRLKKIFKFEEILIVFLPLTYN